MRQFLDTPGSVLEVCGAVGTGRTALLEAAAQAAGQRQLTVLRCRPDPSGAMTPWLPIRRLLADLLHLTDGSSLETLRMCALRSGLVVEDVVGLIRLFDPPRIGQHMEDVVPVAETVRAALRALLSKNQVCFLLDDVDRYDTPSRDLCIELCRSTTGSVNVMLTAQSTLLDPSGLHASIYLDRLPDSEARRLVTVATPAGGSAPSPVIEHLVKMGLPLAIVHGVRLLQEGGTVDRADLEQIITRRLGQLTTAARSLLEAVSILGQSAPLRHVELLLEADVDLAQAEQELRQRALLEPRDDEVVITHERVAQVVHDHMDPRRRKHLHQRMLHLLSSDTGIPSGDLAILAHHAREAQLGTRALDLMEQAGDLALEQHDLELAAMVHYRQARHWARWKLELSSSSTRFVELTLKLARAQRMAGHLLSARSVLSEIVEPTRPALALQFHLERAQLQRARGEAQQALSSLHRAIHLGLAAGQPDQLLISYLELEALLVEQNQQAEAVRELTEGLLMVTGGDGEAADDGPPGLWRLVSRLAGHHAISAPPHALTLARRALFHARRTDSLLGQARCHQQLGQLMMNGLQEEEGYESLGTAATLFRRLGHRRRAAECLLLQARSRPGQGDRSSLASRALALSEQAGWIEGVEQARRITSQP